MPSFQNIEDSVDGIRLTLLESPSQQKTIRSGVFWKRFRFARRTAERIESVKTALENRGIVFDLDPGLFGREPRDQRIVFSIGEFPQPAIALEIDINSITTRLGALGHVEDVIHSDADIFSILFVYFFCKDCPNYQLTPEIFGASTSSWTYHTAIAIAQTCKILDLVCKFESGGKRDALIETRDEVVLLGAEWEWKYEDIFGKGKELEKLKNTCEANESAHAFLLTYCPSHVYLDFIERVVSIWQNYFSAFEFPPVLFLHTIVFEQVGNIRQFLFLKSIVVSGKQIEVWKDSSIN